MTNTGQ